MSEVTVVIPNLNGMGCLEGCLASLRNQSTQDFDIIVVDNGSVDGSADYIRREYPEVRLHCFSENTGFCRAVNTGIKKSRTPYVILLNNDTVCESTFVENLLKGIKRYPCSFSCAAKMVRLDHPELMDDGGDYYCALGWAFAWGKGKPAANYNQERKIFAACGGAAIYRKTVLEQIGLFDEKHFAYLEDIDIGYRARIHGYENWYIPSAVVRHQGSATSGSVYNAFKVKHASRNSVYLVYKNMPLFQMLLNLPLLLAGFFIKAVYFSRKGYCSEYIRGLKNGIIMSQKKDRVVFRWKNLKYYIRIQIELWFNLLRCLAGMLH